jgi:hypothetical protein
MPTGIIGLRGTGEFNVDFRPTNYRELFSLLEPNGSAPLNALLAMTSAEATDDPTYNNFRDELPERQVTVGGSFTNDTSATTIQLSAGDRSFITAGHVLANATTGEIMHVTTGWNGTAVVVTRQIGGGTLQLNTGNVLFIAGFAAQEGADVAQAISFDPSVVFNYTQIFRTPYKLTNTLKETYRRTGSAEDEFSTKALKLHMTEIERAMFFGRRHIINGSTAQPTRFTGGIMTGVSNIYDVSTNGGSPDGAAGAITEGSFDRMLIENVFAYGSAQKIAFVGPRVASSLMAFGKNRWQPTQVEGTYGVSFTRYQTFAGDLLVHLHPQFRQIPGMQNAMVILDFPHLRYRYLQNRDTQHLEGRQGNGEDGKTCEYLTECGLELLQDKVHSVIKGWTKIVTT